jgi:LuxR family quorum-sensing transcriptional regulator LasR
MKSIEQLSNLISCTCVEDWRDQIFKTGRDMGYERTLLAIFPDRNTPVEVEFAFLHTSYSSSWLNKYDDEQMGQVDPVVSHCMNKSVPLIWSPQIFSTRSQNEMYEEACSHGLRSGVTLPIHGANSEMGILCFVSDTKPNNQAERDVVRSIPKLSYFRDIIFETSQQFMMKPVQIKPLIKLTRRELECLQWSITGKSSWDIGQILNCTEAAVNFHFKNIRRKFGTSTRRQAIVKAIRIGIITP